MRHSLTNEMFDARPGRAQLFGEGAVVVDERVLRAGGDQRGRVVAQVGPRRAGMGMRPFLAVNERGAPDEAYKGGVLDDAERR